MATEQMPPELASRDARRRRREFNSLMWLCGWGGVTAIALFAFAIASQTDTAGERLRRVFAAGDTTAIAGMPPRVAQLESATQLLAAQVRALITERDRLSGRIALLESNIDDMSGAIKKQAAATAAVLAAKDNPPTPNPKTQAVKPAGGGHGQGHDRIDPTESFSKAGHRLVICRCRPRASPTRLCLRMTSPPRSRRSSASTWAAAQPLMDCVCAGSRSKRISGLC